MGTMAYVDRFRGISAVRGRILSKVYISTMYITMPPLNRFAFDKKGPRQFDEKT